MAGETRKEKRNKNSEERDVHEPNYIDRHFSVMGLNTPLKTRASQNGLNKRPKHVSVSKLTRTFNPRHMTDIYGILPRTTEEYTFFSSSFFSPG